MSFQLLRLVREEVIGGVKVLLANTDVELLESRLRISSGE